MRISEDRYTCQDCSTDVHPLSYWAQCPECGGQLRTSIAD